MHTCIYVCMYTHIESYGLYDTIKQRSTKRLNNLFTVSWWTMTPADVNQDGCMPQPELKAQRFVTLLILLAHRPVWLPKHQDYEAIRDENSASQLSHYLALPGTLP